MEIYGKDSDKVYTCSQTIFIIVAMSSFKRKYPPIYFYIPQKDWPSEGLPCDPGVYWTGWKPGGHGLTSGVYCWVVLTYLNLKKRGFPCEIVGEIPKEGIVLAHKTSLDDYRPFDKLFLVCITADKSAHRDAHFNIVPDKSNTTIKNKKKYVVSHWLQPGLIPRDTKRQDQFKNIVYLGTLNSLAPELNSSEWRDRLASVGLNWHIETRGEAWNDFSSVDAIVAVRNFRGIDDILKPPQKLFNAWKAGVPIILGGEKGCRALRLSDFDYLEVASVDEAFEAVKKLKLDSALRNKMVENGQVRVAKFSDDNISKQWINLLKFVIIPRYYLWRLYMRARKLLYPIIGPVIKKIKNLTA